MNPRQHLVALERLDDVVVGTGAQAADPLVLLGPRRHRDDGGLRPVAQPADAAIPAPSGWSTLLSGLRRGFHPPLLLAWVVLLWIPAAMATLPAALWLYVQTAHTPQAAR